MKIAVRAASYMVVSGMLAAGSIGACNSDNGSTGGTGADSGTTPSADAGGAGGDTDTGTVNQNPTPDGSSGADTSVPVSVDSGKGTDSSTGTVTDAANGSDTSVVDSAPGIDSALPQTFCGAQTGLSFCEDFDEANPLSLDAGLLSSWTQTVGSLTELTISGVQAASAPNSLLVQLLDGPASTDQSAKVVKMITPTNGVTQAIYEFDLYIDTVPLFATGGFATDFQFDDTSAGSDQFGFRIGVFSNTTGFDHADLEHNHPVLGGNDDITSPIGITAGAWNHVKMVVAYSALANDGGDSVAFQLYTNNSATADVNANYPAPFAKAAFARFAAGMVYAFDGTNKDWGIYYDNFTLKLQ